MTKKELMQLYYLNREILRSTEELVDIKIESRELKNGSLGKRREKMIKKREDALLSKIQDCTDLRDKANAFIESIDDSLTRQIFYCRFSRCMTWQQVAYEVGGGNTNDGVRKIAERYLKKLEDVKI